MYVQFDDNKNPKRPQEQVSAYARFLMQLGLVKSPSQANTILIVLAVVCILGAYSIWQSSMVSKNPANNLLPEQLEQAGAPGEIAN